MNSLIVECVCGHQGFLNRLFTKANVNHCPCGVARYFEDGIPKGRLTEGRKEPEIVNLKVIGSEVKES